MKKPEKKFTLTLEFESEQDLKNWRVYYLGSGEQDADYYIQLQKSTSTHLFLKGYQQCPKCRTNNISTMDTYVRNHEICFEDDKSMIPKDRKKAYKCGNCWHECDKKDVLN